MWKDDQEDLAMVVDKSKGPEMIERELRKILDVFKEGGDTGADQFMDVLEDPEAKDIYTPEYLAHCRACLEKHPYGQKYFMKYPLPAGNGIGPKKLMERQLIFRVV